jgi:predicted nuclease of restriction endonuclease-like RecB superfamily|tara:strand:- start:22 stop:381 length:360 start_codon:yes stop_codon:yes gene_type:complete
MRFRSNFEREVARALLDRDIDFKFEPDKIPYQPKQRVYIPDFYISDNDFYIEVKGRLMQSDRVKHILIKDQNPDLEVKFLFYNAKQKIYKGSKTTNAKWAEKHGFDWAEQKMPKEWFNG